MTAAATCEAPLPTRRIYSETPAPTFRTSKLRVVQLAAYPFANRGARSNVFTIHERLLARGHDSVVLDLTPHQRAKQPGVHQPRTYRELAILLRDTPADLLHLHLGGVLSFRKLVLAAVVNKLPAANKVCTLHLGGQDKPSRSLQARPWGITAAIMRKFDSVIAINPEVANFLEDIRIPPERRHFITPFPRLRVAESLGLSRDIEAFCRRHTPLIASVGEFDHGYDLPKQFDILSKVRERYPSAGLVAIGSGNLHLKFNYLRALHADGNHIELTGTLPEAAAAELIQRANVLLHPAPAGSNSFAILEANKAHTPIVGTDEGPRRGAAYLSAMGDVETAALEVLRSLQIARPQYEDSSAALSDGVDDVIRLYKQLSIHPANPNPLPAGYEWPSMGWGL